MIAVTVALGMSVLGAIAFALWWLDRLIKSEADALRAAAVDQSRRLAGVSTELHHARAEVTRTHSAVGGVRAELDRFVHGPPSTRAPHEKAS